jgi:hypothetical protein
MVSWFRCVVSAMVAVWFRFGFGMVSRWLRFLFSRWFRHGFARVCETIENQAKPIAWFRHGFGMVSGII